MAGRTATPPQVTPSAVGWRSHFRLVASQLPTISLFEDYVDPELLEAAFEIEGRTNPRLRAEAGQLAMVRKSDYMLGPGASPVMAAFTHIGKPSRFTDGSYGVYYAASTIDTAIAEVRFHRQRFLAATREPALNLTLRSYRGNIKKPLLDIRGEQYARFNSARLDSYPRCQKFAAGQRNADHWGLLYPSVRDRGGQCVAFFRPPAVGIPRQDRHFAFHWDGRKIDRIFEIRDWKPASS